jgi:hypothetical protein
MGDLAVADHPFARLPAAGLLLLGADPPEAAPLGVVNSARPRRAATSAVEYQSFPAVDGKQVDAGSGCP